MPVTINYRPEFHPDGDSEFCILCEGPTKHWWGDGCCPVCVHCAVETYLNEQDLASLCKELGFGPIPKRFVKEK